MEPVHAKEALFLFDRVHIFAILIEGDGSLQRAIEDIINMVESIIPSKKQISFLIFFIVNCFL